jgi:hypothetical protein
MIAAGTERSIYRRVEAISGRLNARTPPPDPSVEFPELTKIRTPTGVAPELTDPGIGKLASNAPEPASYAFKAGGNRAPAVPLNTTPSAIVVGATL